MLRIAITILTVCAALSGQSPPEAKKVELNAKSFFPPEYSYEYFVDLEALRETRLWTRLQRRAEKFGGLKAMFRWDFGIKLPDVNQVRGVRSLPLDSQAMDGIEEGQDEQFLPQPEILVFAGGKELQLPEADAGDASSLERLRGLCWIGREEGEIAGQQVVVEEAIYRDRKAGGAQAGNVTRLFAQPQPRVLVYGDQDLITSVLQGKRQGGVPCPDLMVLLSDKKPLAYLASSFPMGSNSDYDLEPFTKDMFPAEDPLRGFVLNLYVQPQNHHVILQGILRFNTGKQGPAMAMKSLPKMLIDLSLNREGLPLDYRRAAAPMPGAKRLIEKIQYQQQDKDLLLTWEFASDKKFAEIADHFTLLFLMEH